jgi:hypothetical protein
MSLKALVSDGARKISRLPGVSAILFNPRVRWCLQTLPGMRLVYGSGWELLHPFDAAIGVDMSGFVPGEQLSDSSFATSKAYAYGGSQPSIIREVLKSIPNLEDCTFIDLGAGKGRPVLVAAGFPFKEVIGVELSLPLAEAAQKNLAIARNRLSGCPPLRMVNGDAATFPYPPGNLVIFLYNPFGASVMMRVIANIQEALQNEQRSIWVIYYNPVQGECFDSSPVFRRYLARTIPYAADERGFGPDEADPVVVWQAGSLFPPEKGADVKISIVKPDNRSELAFN